MNKIENLTWTITNNLPEQIEENLDEKDKKFYEQYSKSIRDYSKMISDSEMDLTKDYKPPKDIYIEVRALENIDNVKTHEGIINVEKNHTYSFRKNDIEHYLRMGMFAINE